jgi:alkanesulfonate monooxygenase SsuD/methylene tetrahydromethanopterin reductase-like flavin-dependent oxidoreductase (luciferase family)
MEFGIFNSLYVPHQVTDGVPDPQVVQHQRLMDEITWTKAADRSGFKYTWATEHHFLTEYSHLSANESFLAYLAGVTERIHLGSGIFNITPPVNHPARVAERVAMIDHLSEGRMEFGVGRGSSSTEQKGFGIEDPELTKAMVDEVFPQFKRMWSTTDYRFDGQYFSMPPRNVLPKPYTDPHPPLWIAAGNPSTFEKAARMGVGVLCFAMGPPDFLKPLVEIYKNTIDQAEPVGDYVNNNVMITSQMLCLNDGQKARDISCDMNASYQNSLVFHYLDTFPKPPGIPLWPDLIPEPTPADIDERINARVAMYGTPEEVAATAQAYADAGVDQVVFGLLSSTIPRDLAVETVETFGTHVLPTFDRDPVHSTVRAREAALA